MNNKNIVKVSHELNHFRGGYTRLELDFIYAFISTIKDEDEQFKDYKLTLQDLENKLQKRLQIKKIEYIFESLIKKSFKIKNDKKLAVYSFFTYLEYDKETRTMVVNFNEKLKPHLIDLYNKVTNKDGKLYAQSDIRYILELRSEYSKRIYMLMCQWKQGTKVVHSVDSLREMLAVPKSYKYNDFKRHVLIKSEAELIEKADIYFSFEEIKTGRRVTEILFRVQQNSKNMRQEAKQIQEDFEKIKLLKEYIGKTLYYNGRDNIIIQAQQDLATQKCSVLLNFDERVERFEMSFEQLKQAK